MKSDYEITPSLFFKYAKSPHWLWYDLHGDLSKKTELPELTQKLIEEGNFHEAKYVKSLPIQIVSSDLSEEEAEIQTLQWMQEGADLIYQGSISAKINGVTYKGRPDLLEKQIGQSKFGNYFYLPIEIKSSTKCDKAEYKKQLMLYSLILENIQGMRPNMGIFINKNNARISCYLDDKILHKTNHSISDILEIFDGNEPPLKLTSTSKESPWFNVLLEEAEKRQDIALIYNLDSRAAVKLRKLGIKTVKDATTMEVTALEKIPYASVTTLERAKLQAQALIDKKIHWLNTPTIPNARTKIYFDIEGDPLLNTQYLFGFWIVEENKKPYFQYFLAKSPDDEEIMWQEFLDWLESANFSDYKVYHYHNYELTQLNKFKAAYGSSKKLEIFIQNLVDLLPIVKSSVILPLYFYSIKDIAKHLNFKWRHQKAGGAQSIFWYEQWLETGDKTILQDIINYNEDDVKATEFLYNWLVAQQGRG